MKLKNSNLIQMVVQTGLRIADYTLTTIALQLGGVVEANPLGFTTLHKILIFLFLISLWAMFLASYKWNDKYINILLGIGLLILNTIMIITVINNSIVLTILLDRI